MNVHDQPKEGKKLTLHCTNEKTVSGHLKSNLSDMLLQDFNKLTVKIVTRKHTLCLVKDRGNATFGCPSLGPTTGVPATLPLSPSLADKG